MQKPRKPQPLRRSAVEWRWIVDCWERSGKSAATFAAEHHLSRRSLTWWRWRLRTVSTSTSGSPDPLAFVPLVAAPGQASEQSEEARWVLETDGGLRVEMSGATPLVVEGLGVALDRVRVKA